MNAPRDEPGESTVTRPDDRGPGNRRFFTRLGAVVLLAAMAYLVWRIVTPLWRPLLWAMLLGALLAPFNLKLSRRLGGRVRLASSITLAIAVLLFLLPITIVAGAVAAQAAHLLRSLEQHVPDIQSGTKFEMPSLPWLDEGLAWLQANAGISLAQVQGWLLEGTENLLHALMASGGTMVMGALGTTVSVMLMLFVLFFVLRDGPKLAQDVAGMLPIDEHRRARLLQHLGDVTRAVFLGIGLTALAQGALVGFGFWIAGLPSALVFGVIAAIAALIPMVGAALVWVPGALFLAFNGDYGHAVFLAAWGALIVSMVDNFLRPVLISGRAEVPTLAVFIGVMGGLAAFGFIGLFVGPIVLGLLVAVYRYEREELGAARGRTDANDPGEASA
jgi:predicted PurR-regulated permease PerM